MGMQFVRAVAEGVETAPSHVENYGKVYEEDAEVEEIGAMEDGQDFEGEINCAGDEGDPFSPRAGMPEAIAFGKTHNNVDKGNGDDSPELAGGQGIGPVEKHLSKVIVGADVQELEEVVGDVPGVVLNDQDDSASANENQRGLRPFERGNGTKHAELGPGILGNM